jgi:hypothetical protein
MPPLVDPNDHDVFILRQRIRPIVNQYEFSIPNGDGQPGEPICFAEQKRFKFKEDIRFYTDDQKSHELMRILAASGSTRERATTVTDRPARRSARSRRSSGRA